MDSLTTARSCAELASDKKSLDLIILELKGNCSLADYFIICSGTSERHVRAIAEHLELEMKKKGKRALGIEGLQQGRWVLLDFDTVIIHVFHEEERDFYDLEGLWMDCPRIAVHDDGSSVKAADADTESP